MLEAVQLLLQHGAVAHPQHIEGKMPLHPELSAGYVNIAWVLLEHGANTDARNNDHSTPLHLAVFSGKPEAVELLTEHGASVDVKSNAFGTALHVATQPGYPDIVLSLLSHGADTNSRGLSNTVCSSIGSLKPLQNGAITDAGDNKLWTPLHSASHFGYLDIMRILLAHGVNIHSSFT